MSKHEFHYTRKAILMYTRYLKRWSREFKRMDNVVPRLTGIEYTTQFYKRCKAHRQYLRKVVGMAFYEDTKAYNTLSNCLLVAGGDPDQIPQLSEWLADLAELPKPIVDI